MAIHAYREIYLNNAQKTLGDAFDYAINTCGISGSDFVKMFTSSSISKRMENGEPALLAGRSGFEIANDVVLETTGRTLDGEQPESPGRTREYWIGWAIAYYQWYSSRSYNEILPTDRV